MPARRERSPHAALPPLSPARVATCLAPPAVDAAEVARACAAVRARLPVLVRGPRPARLRIARALHAHAGVGGLLLAASGRRPALARLPSDAWVYIELDRLAPDAILALSAVLDDGDVGVIAGGDPGREPAAPIAPWLEPARVEVGGASPTTSTAPLAAEGGPTLPQQQLELILTELAHELRNPLVTIKTFAEHLPALLEDEALRTQFAALTAEGVARIDDVLENVLAFARLETPRPQPIDLAPLLDALLADLGPTLHARALTVRRAGATVARCTADPAYVAYGLRNLFTGLAHELPPREELALETRANGVVRVRFTPGGTQAARLRRLVVPEDSPRLGDPTLLPLAFTLARAALSRGGGTLDVQAEPDGAATVVVRLPGGTATDPTT
ncbi:MAG: histidine kinase dimerization/phospho-acceptor domain-containing protein [Candidatus Binatia bacterium]